MSKDLYIDAGFGFWWTMDLEENAVGVMYIEGLLKLGFDTCYSTLSS